MDKNTYKQADTVEVINRMRVAARRSVNQHITDALNDGCARLSALESLIFQLTAENNDLIANIEHLNKLLDEREKNKTFGVYDYKRVVKEFYNSGDEFIKIKLKKHTSPSGNVWYTPSITSFRKRIDALNLPIVATQKTFKDRDDMNYIYLVRCDK